MAATSPPLTVLGRGVLLRALHEAREGRLREQAAPDAVACGERWAALIGYQKTLELPASTVTVERDHEPSDGVEHRAPRPVPEPLPDDNRPPLATSFFVLTGYRNVPQEVPQKAAGSAAKASVQPLTPEQCRPLSTMPPRHVPLVRPKQLWPALQRSLSMNWIGGLDLPRLTHDLAAARLPRRLPRRLDSGLSSTLHVLWDRADHLWPYDTDYRALLNQAHHLHGAAGLRVWQVDALPTQVVGELLPQSGRATTVAGIDWELKRLPAADDHAHHHPADAALQPPPGSTVLLLGDAGSLAASPAAAQTWATWLAQSALRQCRVVLWAPCGPRWVWPGLTACAQVHCLAPGAALRRPLRRLPARSPTDRQADEQARAALRDQLLTRASVCLHLAPPLLRSLRQGAAALAREPATESWAWAAGPLVRSSLVSRALAEPHAATYKQRFAALDAAEQRNVLACLLTAHQYLGRSTAVAETLIWQSHANQGAVAAEKKAVDRAGQWVLAWSAQMERDAATGKLTPAARHYAADLLARTGADERFIRTQATWTSRLWALSGHDEVPAGLTAEHTRQAIAALRPGGAPHRHRWLLDIRARVVGLTSEQSMQHPGLHVMEDESCWIEQAPDGPRQVLRRPVAGHLRLLEAGRPGQQLRIRAGGRELTITEFKRPAWACEWGRDRYGLFAALEVGGVVQRLRWIEPGTFLMGSPPDKPERYDDEGPQHAVTLTQGYWLADTACTQALWEAVVGDRPSYFKGEPDLPVEQVSWDNVIEKFLPALNRQLPGAQAILPTEAQWEYACRAGTTTAYEFGDAFEPSLANVGSDKTVPVKSLPANRWGLYQMHGNVLEWCADACRTYRKEAVEDPDGGQQGSVRALRGGSWGSVARWARCAFRSGPPRSNCGRGIGFRFALRSVEQGGGDPGQAESGEVVGPSKAGQARPRTRLATTVTARW